MTIKRENQPDLFEHYEWYKAVNRGNLTIGDLVYQFHHGTRIPNKGQLFRFYENFCKHNGLSGFKEEEKLKAFLTFNHQIFAKIFSNFEVEVVAESFLKSLEGTELEKSLNGMDLFGLFGECSGKMVFTEGYMQYAITSEGCFFRYYPRERICFFFSYVFGEIGNKKDYTGEEYNPFFWRTLEVLLLKKVGKVETVMVAKGAKRTIGDEVVVNKTPFPIHRLDSSWFKTVIRTEGFMVKGHWKLQACGKAWKDHKLIYIKPFQKHGYVRTAPAIISRASGR